MSRFLQDAVATELGYAHPLTGELLKRQRDLDDPVAYYKPNGRNKAFLDPEGEVDGIIVFQKLTDLKVRFAVHDITGKKITSVTWTFAHGEDEFVGGTGTTFTFPEAGTYEVSALVAYDDETDNTYELELELA